MVTVLLLLPLGPAERAVYLSSVILISPLCVLNLSKRARKEKRKGKMILRMVMTPEGNSPTKILRNPALGLFCC